MAAGSNIFQKYPNNIFIETGSLVGDGIQHALNAGFKTIYSIELLLERYNFCLNRFKDNDNVHLIFGNSYKELPKLLNIIKEPVTFWLDAHYSGEEMTKEEIEIPLIKELEIIGTHYIKTHTILIDDLRCWTIEKTGFNTETIKSKISQINNNYIFVYEYGHEPNDILVAKV